MAEIVTRFAPSPTGYLHIGGLRTALFNYLFARANGGRFLLRIEDTDMARNSALAAQAIIDSFKWVGLDYDGEVVYQSKRFDIYKKIINQLLEQGDAYYCYMSKEELDNLRESQRASGQTPKYDNRYRDFKGTPPQGIEPVVRIKAPLEGEIYFKDGIKGEMRFNAKELDDFIIARSDGSPTYNFVVSIDDALMGVSDVLRGDDHLSNTPKQIIIYNALGFKVPKFYHLPMILNPQGKKLSKRDGAMGVMDYKDLGYLPQSLLNFLVRLGWSYGDKEIFSMQEMLNLFNPNELNSSPSAFNQEKLLWLNQHYIKESSNENLSVLLADFGIKDIEDDKKEVLFPALKERSQTLKDFALLHNEVLNAPQSYDEKMRLKLDINAKIWLTNLLDSLNNADFSSTDSINDFLHKFVESKDIKIGKLMPICRCALLGKSGGIGVVEAMFVIGKDECKARFSAFLNTL